MANLKYDTTAYADSIGAYRNALAYALEIANDSFKAPELTVMIARRVQECAWNMQVEFAAMLNYNKNVVG
jgi:hypothetical protein